MAKRKPPKRDPYLSQAQLAGVVRFQPKYDVLLQALADAQSTRDNDIAAAKTSAQGSVKALDLAKPQVQQLYTDAGLNPSAAAAPITPPAEVNFGSAAQFEQQAGQHRLGTAQARALQDLSDQRLSALAGGEYGAKAANARFASDSFKLSQQLASVGDQQGAFVANELGKLHEAARKRALQRRGQDITLRGQDIQQALGTSRINATLRGQDISAATQARGQNVTLRGQDISRENSIRTNNNRNTKNRWASPAAITNAQDVSGNAVHQAQMLKASGASRREIAEILRSGSSATQTPVYRTVKTNSGTKQVRVLNRDGTPKIKSVPGIPQVKSEALLGVAVDIAVDGHLSPYTVRKLHRAGIPVAALGYKTYRQVRPAAPYQRKGIPGRV